MPWEWGTPTFLGLPYPEMGSPPQSGIGSLHTTGPQSPHIPGTPRDQGPSLGFELSLYHGGRFPPIAGPQGTPKKAPTPPLRFQGGPSEPLTVARGLFWGGGVDSPVGGPSSSGESRGCGGSEGSRGADTPPASIAAVPQMEGPCRGGGRGKGENWGDPRTLQWGVAAAPKGGIPPAPHPLRASPDAGGTHTVT